MPSKPFNPDSFDPNKKPQNYTKGYGQYALGLDHDAWNEIEDYAAEYRAVDRYPGPCNNRSEAIGVLYREKPVPVLHEFFDRRYRGKSVNRTEWIR